MPADKTPYARDWPAISAAIRARGGNRCEGCGVANGAVGARDRHGVWHDEAAIHHLNRDDGEGLFGDFPDMIRIVLTTAHLNHDTDDNSDDNLKSWCQLCHNRHDAPMRARHAAETRRRKRLALTGQLSIGGLA